MTALLENRPPLGRPREEWHAICERFRDDARVRMVAARRVEPALAHLYSGTAQLDYIADTLRFVADDLDPADDDERRLRHAMNVDAARELVNA